MYVRVELASVPCELVRHLHPAAPLVLGGLLKGEDQLGFIQVRALHPAPCTLHSPLSTLHCRCV